MDDTVSASDPRRITRRALMGAAGWTLSGVAVASLLQACAPTPVRTAPTPAASTFAYPSYIPFQGPAPDLPGTPQGVPDAYFSYPRNLVKTVLSPPGAGDDVTFFVSPPGGVIPPPVEQNAAWQQVNKELKVNFKLNLAGTAQEANEKLGSMVAGGELPDLIFIGPVANIGNMAEFVQAKCADLTPFLAGDAVKTFPNLANYPTYTWKGPNVVFNNKIYGVPIWHSLASNLLLVRQDLADQAGNAAINTADDFKRALQAVTRPDDNVWGIADQNFILTPYFAAQLFGAPNNWGLDANGKLVKDLETDQFKAGISYLRDLWSAGVFHPNSATYNNVSFGQDFRAGRFVYCSYLEDAFTAFWSTLPQVAPTGRLGVVPPFSNDGTSKARYFLGTGVFGVTIMNNGSADRVREVLGVLNYFGAPFGSQELELLTYGVQGTDFTLDPQGNPIPSQNSFATHPVPWALAGHGPNALYNPVRAMDFASTLHNAEQAAISAGVQDATLGLYSPTNSKLGPALKQALTDGIASVVTGRQPFSDWDQVVKDWQNNGGNQIRTEYQQGMK